MKIAVALAVVIGSSAFAAPTAEVQERTKKSTYPGGSYGGGPVGYGAAASYGPPCAGAPVALYLAPQAAPHYREDDVHQEHSEQARSSYGGYGAGLGSLSSGAGAGAGAIGYFPHAQIGGCGVPLLLSCSPKVVAGHLAKAHSYSVPSYKNTENQEETTELKEAMEKGWSDAERAASNLDHHHDHHHHLISINHLEHDHAHKALTA